MKSKSVQEIKEIVDALDEAAFMELLPELSSDSRKSVRDIALKKRHYFDKIALESARVRQMIEFDLSHHAPVLAGVDEVGRGPLAGPVVAACVIMDLDKPILKVNDSKKLSKQLREELYQQIVKNSLFCAIAEVDNHTIDRINILNATHSAMTSSIKHVADQCGKTGSAIRLVLIDGNQTIPSLPFAQKAVVKGDSKSYSIACASIVAKVHRDNLMTQLHQKFPSYNFDQNFGYGTAEHTEAIKKTGLSDIHRKSFCKNFI